MCSRSGPTPPTAHSPTHPGPHPVPAAFGIAQPSRSIVRRNCSCSGLWPKWTGCAVGIEAYVLSEAMGVLVRTVCRTVHPETHTLLLLGTQPNNSGGRYLEGSPSRSSSLVYVAWGNLGWIPISGKQRATASNNEASGQAQGGSKFSISSLKIWTAGRHPYTRPSNPHNVLGSKLSVSSRPWPVCRPNWSSGVCNEPKIGQKRPKMTPNGVKLPCDPCPVGPVHLR